MHNVAAISSRCCCGKDVESIRCYRLSSVCLRGGDVPRCDYKRSTSLIGENSKAPRGGSPPRDSDKWSARLAYVKRDRSAEWSARGRAGDLNPSARITRLLVWSRFKLEPFAREDWDSKHERLDGTWRTIPRRDAADRVRQGASIRWRTIGVARKCQWHPGNGGSHLRRRTIIRKCH